MYDLYQLRWVRLAVLISALYLSGCASLKAVDIHPVAPVTPVPSESSSAWWFVRIQWQWPEDHSPAWHLDLLAAHQILLPIVNAYEKDIRLWRVHRRAASDEAGHQFSFIFYASSRTASAVYADIADDSLLSDLTDAGLLKQVLTKPFMGKNLPEISDTSDPAWSPMMQAAWPYYIDGVSRMWLDLVSRIANEMMIDSEPVTVDETVELYRQVDIEISNIWRSEGRHALLHHLNAVFGYRPIPIRF